MSDLSNNSVEPKSRTEFVLASLSSREFMPCRSSRDEVETGDPGFDAAKFATFIAQTPCASYGWVDLVIQRIVDVLYAFPSLLFIIIIMTYLQGNLGESDTALAAVLSDVNDSTGGLLGVLIALGLVFWLTISRIVRGEVLALKEKEFILAARAIGGTSLHIMMRHILPNIMAPVLVAIAFGIPNVIMLEAGLSYLGLGTKPPVPSWGLMIAEGVKSFRSFPHLLISPGLTLAITLLSFNYLGDGIRQALDPSLRND